MRFPTEQQARQPHMWRATENGRWRTTGFWSYRAEADKMRAYLSFIGIVCTVDETADGKWALVTEQRPWEVE